MPTIRATVGDAQRDDDCSTPDAPSTSVNLGSERHGSVTAATCRPPEEIALPVPSEPLSKLGFLTIGLFDGASPAAGHESTLEIIALGERLGFNSAWVRHRHLQFGISSPVAVLAAASQRTSRIELGTAVIPLGWENPLRLAEDLATVDVLSGGRLNPGISVGPPMHYDEIRDALYPETGDSEDFGYGRVKRLLGFIRGEPATSFRGVEGIEIFSDRVEPHAKGLAARMWYGGGSLRSARWAGENGMNFLTSSVVKAEESQDFSEIQLSHIRTFRANHPAGGLARVCQGLVVIPTDSASRAQREKYERYVAARTPRTSTPQGPGQMMFALDLVGTSEQLAERLYANPAFREIDEVAFALPFSFEHDDYVQILSDMAGKLGPALGWRPGAS
jgi:alkanesulfonate monooxygenase SsuD/methylene tetrahydromethanopterin reductase-like flavin-dependent oxidoreductase (luciferase family)